MKGLHTFLGHVGFYHRFIKDFSKIAHPLFKLLEEKVKAFEGLKEKLISTPILITPNWTQPFDITCDSSGVALGLVFGERVRRFYTL